MICFPNAKINIGLNIIEKRKDGFHNIETIFYPLQLSDTLEFIEIKEESSFENTGLNIDCSLEKNLIWKAYSLLKTDFKLPNLKIHLHKIIPFGAGLGGGSSDAAFMLKSLNEYFSLNLSIEKLKNYASKLGSDCSFFIENKPLFAKEKGDVFESIDLSLKDYNLILIHPKIHISTPEAYAGVTPQKPENNLKNLIAKPIKNWGNFIFNDFEKNIFKNHTEIAKIKNNLYENGALYASMSGSGSSVFGIFKDEINIDFISKNKDYFIWKELMK